MYMPKLSHRILLGNQAQHFLATGAISGKGGITGDRQVMDRSTVVASR